MHIQINDNTTLSEIQRVFSEFYPFLRLEFYSKRHKKYEASDESYHIDPEILIGDIKAKHVPGILEVQPSYKVADLERELQQRFGLPVQVLRKHNDTWKQTTGTDDFTLKELNEISRNSSDEFILDEDEESLEEMDERPEKLL